VGGSCHLKLNLKLRPIANKYHEGRMKRTLERELKVSAFAGREAKEIRFAKGLLFLLK